MADMIEKIAMGGLALRGHIDLQITDPLTGRAYYKFEDHNLVLDGLYEYLKMLCIAALCSYNGAYGYRPMTVFGSGSTEEGYFDGFALVSVKTPTGDASRGPSTDSGYGVLKSPVHRIVLTDGAEPEDVRHTDIIGNIIAEANLSTAASSGGTKGVFSYAKSYENWRRLYRRWDWSSANGNGKIGRLHLCTARALMPLLDRTQSRSALSALTFSGTYLGTIGNRLFFCTNCSASEVAINCVTYDAVTMTYTEQAATLDLSGYNSYPNSQTLAIGEGTGGVVYLASRCNNYYFHIYTLYADGTLTGMEVGYRLDNSIYYVYLQGDGALVLYSYRYKYAVSLETKAVTGVALPASISSNVGLQQCVDGHIKVCSGNTTAPYTYDLDTEIDVATQTGAGFGRFNGLAYYLLQDGVVYRLACYQSDTIPYTQIDAIPDLDRKLYTMTERLLPEPVVKDNMPMYVGYTLEFE